MIRSRVFISAPFSAPTQAERDWNTARAVALGQLAVAMNLAPFVPHVAVSPLFRGDESYRGDAMAINLAWVRGAAMDIGGQFWLLLRDDRGTSEGCRAERVEWEMRKRSGLAANTWEAWRGDFERYGLVEGWRELRGMPALEGAA